MIFEFNKPSQFLAMRPFLGESVLLSPGKCLCLPSVEGSALTIALTNDEELHTAKFRFRRSGPMHGQIFAGAKAVKEHVNALRTAAFVARQPEFDRLLLEFQVIVQVLHYEHINSPNIVGIIIDKIAETIAGPMGLSENLDPDSALVAYQWRRLLQGGQWNGKILVQLTSRHELVWLYKRAHGRGFCSDGHRATLEISSPSRASLATELFSWLATQPGGSAA